MKHLVLFAAALVATMWSAAHGANKITIPVKNIRNVQYGIPISLGTPKQDFWVLLDTGSCDLWVPASNSRGGNNFNMRSSSSFKGPGSRFSMQYGDGALISGVVAEDILTLGENVRVKVRQTFGLATSTQNNERSRTDGIIGLNFKDASHLPNKPDPVIYNLQKQGFIPQIGLFLSSNKDKRDGELVFGGINEDLVEGEFTYASVPPGKYEDNWFIQLDGIEVNGRMLPGSKMLALVDSGSSTMVGPARIINRVNQEVWPPGRNEWREDYFSCKDLDFSKLPDVTFYINNKPLSLPATAYISQFKSEDLPGHQEFVQQLDAYKMTEDERKPYLDQRIKCEYGFHPDPSGGVGFEHFILGQNFLREYYTEFNFDKKIIGFAKALRGTRRLPKPTVTRPPGGGEAAAASVPDSPASLGGLFGSNYESESVQGNEHASESKPTTGSDTIGFGNIFSSVSQQPSSKTSPEPTNQMPLGPLQSAISRPGSQKPETFDVEVEGSDNARPSVRPSFRLPLDSSWRTPVKSRSDSQRQVPISGSDTSNVKPITQPVFQRPSWFVQSANSREQEKENARPSVNPSFRLPIDSSAPKPTSTSQSYSQKPGLSFSDKSSPQTSGFGLPNYSRYDKYPYRQQEPYQDVNPVSTERSSYSFNNGQSSNPIASIKSGKLNSQDELASWFDGIPSSRKPSFTDSRRVSTSGNSAPLDSRNNGYDYTSAVSNRAPTSPYSAASGSGFGGLTSSRFNAGRYSDRPVGRPSLTDFYNAYAAGHDINRSNEPVQPRVSSYEVPSPAPSSLAWSPSSRWQTPSPVQAPPPPPKPEPESKSRLFNLWNWRRS